ncbi:hypothetical protein GCM10011386_14310 [Parapedobacter defluvii]|uniref:SH3 domain-containing protein n=1 Tax=Parapedobacter defluvii TaxID=2045106 RepID=A0ABQ1LEV3_9SPHI|nr:hypothetical protein [Parapedobacter defluvii]RQP08673.1 MAG: hypothetical protein EAS52_24825 [Parapedobacter sp.]GGC23522.1 hypothetical protein GCM10011386_14310 [Parapedobacter defluvii]
MKAVVLYFLSLFFLLIGGMDCTHANVQQRRIYHAPVDKNARLTVDTPHQSGPIITKNFGIKRSGDEVTCVEDDDMDFVFVRKYMPLAKYAIVPSYTTAFLHGDCGSRDRNALCKYLTFSLSHKYITQRVLKI